MMNTTFIFTPAQVKILNLLLNDSDQNREMISELIEDGDLTADIQLEFDELAQMISQNA